MSDKSEIEAIRVRDAEELKENTHYTNPWANHLVTDRHTLLSHVDALEARVARLEAALENAELIYENGGSAKSMVLVISAALAQVKP